jgi:cyclopropane-fatty-acyl-phospholipid synthase
MSMENSAIREVPTAAQQRYQASVSVTHSRSLPHERFGLERVFEHLGRPRLVFKLWDGFSVGTDEEAIATITFHNRAVLYRMLLSGEVAFGDGYSEGSIEIDGNLVDMIVEKNVSRHNYHQFGSPFQRFSLSRFRPPNTMRRSQENIHHHYDVGNDFYRLWLDREMQYTCAYFPDPDMTLEAAQQAKMDHVCRKLRLQPGDRVVEAGCGWGGLARHMAKYYGATVTAYNISKEQVRFASDRARSDGYANQVKYVEDDYRNIKGTFDVFVSVGMLEHVGKENYRALGSVVDTCLDNEGRALIHSIGRNVARPMSAWIDRRIFPGAYPPTLREIMDVLEPSRFSVLDVENLRLHYARTLEHWLDRFEGTTPEVIEMFDEKFVRAWRLYLSGSIATFLTGGLQLFQVLFTRERNNQIPWSREHLY